MKALIVDDQKSVVNSILQGLPEFQWTYALSAEEAIEKLNEKKFDLMITDVRMPGMDGIELLKRVDRMNKKGRVNPHMAKIILTGYDDSKALDYCVNEIGTYRVEKPWGDELEITIKRALEYYDLLKKQVDQKFNNVETKKEEEGKGRVDTRVAKAVHELNNPLTGIAGYVELLLDKIDDPIIQNDLKKILNEAKRCHTIVNDFLSYSKCHVPEYTEFDLHQAMNQSIARAINEVSVDSSIEIITQYHLDDIRLNADQELLQAAFINLIKNSMQMMKSSGIGGTLKITTSNNNKYFCISFIDNGPGIKSENVDRIFDPFFTTKGKKGNGLGLSIVQDILKAHGGYAKVSADTIGGAMFTLFFPKKCLCTSVSA